VAARAAAARLTPREFQSRLDVSRENMERLTIYAERLVHWNNRINLVGAATVADLWLRHMLDSAQLIAHLPPRSTDVIDLGTGAGFPGLVLAILSGVRVHLIESDTRKAAFLGEVARMTEAPATVHPVRIEDLTPFPVDVIAARALAPLPKLLAYSSPILEFSANRAPICMFLKGARWQEELTMAQKGWNMQVNSLASISDPTSRVLILGNVSRKESAP
jgi:16S rRNA (guanine527-N7)-methyltransferase